MLKTRDLIKQNSTITQKNFICNLPRSSRFPCRHWWANLKTVDNKIEQDEEQNIQKLKQWLQTGEIEEGLQYANSKMRRYYRQLDQLEIENDLLYRKCFDDDGTVKHKQLRVPHKLPYRIHNSKTAGHSEISRRAQEFRKRLYFSGSTEYLIETIKICLTCMQLKRAYEQNQRPNLQKLTTCIHWAIYSRRHDANWSDNTTTIVNLLSINWNQCFFKITLCRTPHERVSRYSSKKVGENFL